MELKNSNIDDLIRPVDAFITFEEEDGKIVAEEFEPQYNFWGTKLPSQKEFLGDELCLVEATEPTNIIWENRHFTSLETFRRSLRALAAIVCLLLISFLTIYYFKSKGINTSRMYPSISQSEILRLYQTPKENTLDNSKMQLFYDHAVQEYEYFSYTRNTDITPVLSGFYPSFCKVYSSNPERFIDIKVDKTLCDMYNSDQLSILLSNQIVKFLIIGINVVLRMLIIKLITYIGVDTESEQTRLITNGVFVV
jgi:hypothetical protein